ncbi:opioid growth factor receptor conserved region-domain-containing protein [Pisolithus sp. B1]|nr:opioid growth factor receptor conserved region-domain-containing protein [Pisolithus sp. B1]
MAVNLPRDIRAFLSGYRGLASSPQQTESSDNLDFYRNRLRCQPDGLLVEEILDQWKGDYNKLEFGHGYIQWLFPIQEDGMNFAAQRLMPHELSAMRADAEVMRRIVRAYTMMLDFYGMRLQSEETGLVGRAVPPGSYSSRYVNLLFSPHNNLRISRILKCLSELGLEHLNAGEHEELTTPFIRDSMDRWWANCIRNDREREWIAQVIARVRSGQLVFTRQMYENVLEGRRQTGEFPTEVLDRNAS